MGDVINLFNRKKSKIINKNQDITNNLNDVELQNKTALDSLKEAEVKNLENKERLKKERLKNNKGVLKSYRIKN